MSTLEEKPKNEMAISNSPPSMSEGEYDVVDKHRDGGLLARLDMSFMPIIMLAYLTCFLDRSNIGNAKTGGLEESIGISTTQYSTAVSIFYATYIVFETPWAIALKKIGPKYQMTGLAIIWSAVTIASGWMSNAGGLYATRLILGACEAGLFPGLNLYLTMVYQRDELAKRVSYLFVCTALSGAFGGLLAYGLLQMDGTDGLAGWQWLYIIEGVISFAVAFAIFFGLPNDPNNAWLLKKEDKELLKVRAVEREAYMGSDQFDWNEVKIAARDPKVYMSGAIQFCQDILLYGFSTFLPSIVKGMGYGTLETQYLTIPVFLTGGACFVGFAILSDRYKVRSLFVVFANCFGIIGYIILLSAKTEGVKYFATFLCAIAVYTGPGLNLTWLNVNMAPHYRRATAVGIQQSIGNSAGIVAGQIYRTSPYKLGNSFSLGVLCLSQGLLMAKYFYIKHLNAQKVKMASGEIPDTRKVKNGDKALDYVYHL